MRLISRKAGSHDPIPLHRITPVRPVCLDRLCPDYEERAARTIPLRRFCLFIFSRCRLCCRLDHVSTAAIEMTDTALQSASRSDACTRSSASEGAMSEGDGPN